MVYLHDVFGTHQRRRSTLQTSRSQRSSKPGSTRTTHPTSIPVSPPSTL